MLRMVLWLTCFCFPLHILPFNVSSVSGTVVDNRKGIPLSSVSICLNGCEYRTVSLNDGAFLFKGIPPGEYDLHFSLSGYRTLSMPVSLTVNKRLELGVVRMEPEAVQADAMDGVGDSEGEFISEGDMSADFTTLNALREPYERRVAFNFSQAFYRYRGYDSRYREVLINGMPVNDPGNGRAPYDLWGGLNDVFRNREFVPGTRAVAHGSGSLGGSLEFLLDPALNRKGLRISSSASNRSYAGRFMATYNSGSLSGPWSYTFSTSRRWAEEGYVQGTLYDALSFYGAVRYRISEKDALVLNTFYTPRRSGSRPAMTREVAALAGPRYNPYWGYHGGELRHSRLRRSRKPVFLLNYLHRAPKADWQLGLLYTTGTRSTGRIGYFNAPNPDPVYYRYLPSFQVNSGIVNFENARLVRENFLKDPQINWKELVQMNAQGSPDGRAFYLLYDDVSAGSALGIAASAIVRASDGSEFNAGLSVRMENTTFYAMARDLLGAKYHLDEDPFSGTRNHLDGDGVINAGDRFRYNYRLNTRNARAFVRYNRRSRKGQAYVALEGVYLGSVREGMFRNERYPDNSSGKGDPVALFGASVKAGGTYRFDGRHMLSVDGVLINRVPALNSLYVNPRENHFVVDGAGPEKIMGAELRYRMDLSALRSRLALFYTGFSDVNKVSYYYLDGGVGNAFVQELRSGVESVHLGGEWSLEYDLSSDVKADLVIAYGDYRYTSNPDLTINFNTVNEEQVIDRSGSYDLGKAGMDGLYIANGPQSAIAAGIEYRSPDYWWVGAVASYLDRNYVGVSGVRRTESFFTDPETGIVFEEADDVIAKGLLGQERLQPLYYLDLTAGKSWLFNSIYISLFLSVNNLFNAVYETGGYEQHRTANYRDLYNDSLSGTPSFGNKYWYGSGRTFFVNLAVNL